MNWAQWVGTLGGLMQLAGVGLVFWDIAEIEGLFQRRPWLRRVWDRLTAPLRWLGILPRRITGVVTTPVGVSLTLGMGRVRVRQRGATLETRIAAIEAQLDDVDKEMDLLWDRLGEQKQEFARKLGDIEERQRAADESLRKLVEAANMGSIDRRIFGVIVIAVGTLLTVVALWL